MSDTPQNDASRKRLLEVIDCTPTWKELVPALVTMVCEGNAKTQNIGMEQLMRMATAADAYNASVHRMQEALRVGEQAMSELRERVNRIAAGSAEPPEAPGHGS